MSRFRFFILVALAYAGYPWWRFLISQRASRYGKNERFLVIPQNNRLGDLVCATPVLRAIKERYPKSYVAVLISRAKSSWEIIKNNPRVDEIIFYEDPRLLKTIRAKNFSWSFNLTTYPIPSVLAFLGLIPHRAKTTIRDRSLSELLTDCLNTEHYPYKHHTSVPAHYLRLIDSIGIKNPPVIKEIFLSPAGEKKAAAFLQDKKISADDFLVGISITAGNKVKEWGDERFAELGKRIIEAFGAKVILLGGPHDNSRLAKTKDSMGRSGEVSIANGFSIEDLPSLMKRLKLYIAVDTGPIYIAHALRVPLIDITGPCDAREQPPEDERSICVKPMGIEPSSFVFKRPGLLALRRRAVEATSVDQVFSAVKGLIERLNLAKAKR